jgi:DNA-binding transcriptional LysR family regulator
VPFLSYASGAYMARVVEMILQHADVPLPLDAVYETDMAEGLKAMALEGHGLAFLPSSAVRSELRAGRLVSAAPPGMDNLQITMDVRLYREKPASRDGHRGGHRGAPKRTVQALWDYLQQQA